MTKLDLSRCIPRNADILQASSDAVEVRIHGSTGGGLELPGGYQPDRKYLIGRRLSKELISVCLQSGSQLSCQFIGVFCQMEVQIIGQQCLKLDTCHEPFGQHGTAILDGIAEIALDGRCGQNQSFTIQCSVFCAANIKGVG